MRRYRLAVVAGLCRRSDQHGQALYARHRSQPADDHAGSDRKGGPAGYYMAEPESVALCRKEIWVPGVLDRNPYVIWEQKGSKSLEERVKDNCENPHYSPTSTVTGWRCRSDPGDIGAGGSALRLRYFGSKITIEATK